MFSPAAENVAEPPEDHVATACTVNVPPAPRAASPAPFQGTSLESLLP